jgi:hypothetical protein
MRYDWDDDLARFSFFLDPQIPYVVGANAETVIDRLLLGTGLRRSDIAQWLVRSGGKKVIDAVVVNLGLSRHDVRHTVRVLRDHGNVSSGSFLFSYERLVEEGVTRPGDYGVLMTMGPVEMFAHGTQVRERLTKQIADWLIRELEPNGVGVVIEAEHLCMTLRGVQAVGARTITSTMPGVLRDDARSRGEFLAAAGLGGR